MIRTTLIAICTSIAVAAAAAGGPSGSQSKPSVSGTWKMAIKGQGAHGDASAELTLTQDGTKVTGRLHTHAGEHPVDGQFSDRKLTLATAPDDHQLALTAVLKDDGTLEGYLSGPMGDLRWTASRAGAGQ